MSGGSTGSPTTSSPVLSEVSHIKKANLLRQLSLNRIDVEQQAMRLSNGVEGTCPEPVEGYFGEYPADYFDFIIIDECHRGGANDEGNWRGIMEYFSPAVQLGLTATPKRKDNADTYKYFGEPVYIYSLKEGINDGFLTPFKVKRIKTTLDDYIYTSDDQIIEGEIEARKSYPPAWMPAISAILSSCVRSIP